VGRGARRGAADEALVLLCEALLLAALLLLSTRLWAARRDPYPQLVAQLINASPEDAELLIVLPRPVRVNGTHVCRAGECSPIVGLERVEGAAWSWLRVYKRRLAEGGGGP